MGASEQGVDAFDGQWITVPRTLCFVFNGDAVLLMKRSEHKRVFPNRYNGVGGHLKRNEDPLSGIRREVHEETGLAVENICLRAVYNIDVGVSSGVVLFLFTATANTRSVSSSAEGTLHWIPRDKVLDFDLVDDLPKILPRIFAMQSDDPPLFVHLSYDVNDYMQLRIAEVE